ncbi:Uncharacterised protein [uncultured archaeon]|nr:Uncharacterised protein [uncultured archaeon]
MIQKYPLCPQRIRKVPSQFSWVDHRLVRERYLESINHPAAALYLFLVTVADAQGLSYYSDASITARLSMDLTTLVEARRNLIAASLIAYQKPLYQVLSLEPNSEQPAQRTPLEKPLSVARIFKQMMRGAS